MRVNTPLTRGLEWKAPLSALFFVLWGIIASLQANGQEPMNSLAVFERHITVVGGRPTLDTIESVMAKGSYRDGDVKWSFEFRAKRSGAYVLSLNLPQKSLRYGRNPHGQNWCEEDGAPLEQSTEQMTRYDLLIFAFLPHAKHPWIGGLEKAICREHKFGADELVTVTNSMYHHFPTLVFLKATGRVRRIQQLEFRDYRLAEGIFAPFMIKEGRTGIFIVQKLEFIQPMDDSLFETPAQK